MDSRTKNEILLYCFLRYSHFFSVKKEVITYADG
jgi:hypothetical protein